MNNIKSIILNNLKVITSIDEYMYEKICCIFSRLCDKEIKLLKKLAKNERKETIIKEIILYCYADYNKLFENGNIHTDDLYVLLDMLRNINFIITNKYPEMTIKYNLLLVDIIFKSIFYILNKDIKNSFIFHQILKSSIELCEYEDCYEDNHYKNNNKYKYFCC